MITLTPQAKQNPDTSIAWRLAMREAIRDPLELLDQLGLAHHPHANADNPLLDFPLLVPRGYVARMRFGDPHDPLLLQVLPQRREYHVKPGFVADPVGDMASLAAPGLLHKYHGRALIITTGACAIHCRYCFRRHYPYSEASAGRSQWRSVLDALVNNVEIEEIILSGGDPLMLDDAKLFELVRALEEVPHILRLRIHTRLPVVLPERVDENLIDWIGRTRLKVICVIHSNHPNEVDNSVKSALENLRNAGVTLLNQSVLLKGINDTPETLRRLSLRLFECSTLPYYLHLLDPVAGAAHFEVEPSRAAALVQELRASLPGYLVPKLVREEAGQPSKSEVAIR